MKWLTLLDKIHAKLAQVEVKMVLYHGRRRQLKRLSVHKNAALIWSMCQPAGYFYVVGKSFILSVSSLEKQDLRTNTVQNKTRFMLHYAVPISLPAIGLERSMCTWAACNLSQPEAVSREMIITWPNSFQLTDCTTSVTDDKQFTGP